MEVKVKKIGNSVGIIFPKVARMQAGEEFTLRMSKSGYILTPKIKDIYHTDEFWGDVRSELTAEDHAWDEMKSLETEVEE
ncbi:hypothetical protein P7G51_10815 [Enterococcus asini]|uniref:AbrB/MazE/SpoVT family DNA-binding domain-containing protein n=1 Tax=Enterococcus asini TaxID=57732 RepID=UPI00288DD941|nr:hypothetical protein [Enterococcus asini]MDT2757871.1 hypothetical protein [Enterococcus asini]